MFTRQRQWLLKLFCSINTLVVFCANSHSSWSTMGGKQKEFQKQRHGVRQSLQPWHLTHKQRPVSRYIYSGKTKLGRVPFMKICWSVLIKLNTRMSYKHILPTSQNILPITFSAKTFLWFWWKSYMETAVLMFKKKFVICYLFIWLFANSCFT